MDWIDHLAERVRDELDFREGPLTLTTADLKAIAGDEPLPQESFWSSLRAYLVFGLRGIDVHPVRVEQNLVGVTFQAKRFVVEWLPVERATYFKYSQTLQRECPRQSRPATK